MKNFKNFVIVALCVMGFSMSMTAQTSLPNKGYYLGISTGSSMGACTFRSYTDNSKTARAEFGLFAGYRFSNLFSLELSGMRGNIEMTASDEHCNNMWLGLNGMFIESSVTPPAGWSGKDLTTKTKFARFAVQGNFNILYIFKNLRDSRWKLDLSPMIGMVQTHTTACGMMITREYNKLKYNSQWHFAYGGQGSIGVAINNNIEVRLYAGINFLSGDRFDNLVNETGSHPHTENFIYEGGAKLSWNFGKAKKDKAVEVVEEKDQQDCEEGKTDLSGVEKRLDDIHNEIVRMREEAQAKPQGNTKGAADYSTVFGSYPFSIFFGVNSSELKSDNDRINLQAFAKFAKEHNCKVRLKGSCDKGTGSVDYNQALSQRRCDTVKDELVKYGLDAENIIVEAVGGVSEFSNLEGNRRVFLDFVN